MKKVFYQAGMVIALLLLLRAEALAAAVDMADMDMQFVDASGMTGYYVDMGSLDFQNDHEVTAWVEIVRADKDRLYLYRIHFDRKKRTYQILESVMAEYATKERLGDNSAPTAVTAYAPGSPMESVVEFIFSPQP